MNLPNQENAHRSHILKKMTDTLFQVEVAAGNLTISIKESKKMSEMLIKSPSKPIYS